MKKMMLGALALAVAVPAYAQTPPAEHKTECCDKMMQDGKDCCCCKDMAGKGHDGHAKHDKAKADAAHQGHEGHVE